MTCSLRGTSIQAGMILPSVGKSTAHLFYSMTDTTLGKALAQIILASACRFHMAKAWGSYARGVPGAGICGRIPQARGLACGLGGLNGWGQGDGDGEAALRGRVRFNGAVQPSHDRPACGQLQRSHAF